MTEYSYVGYNGNYSAMPSSYSGIEYEPIGRKQYSDPNSDHRVLPDPMIIEAAMIVGGGGFGAENVQRYGYGGRKEYDGTQDDLVLRGALTEAIRGVVGIISSSDPDGYVKMYYMDERFLRGIVPGDIWLKNKYVPAPAGWVDYSDYTTD